MRGKDLSHVSLEAAVSGKTVGHLNQIVQQQQRREESLRQQLALSQSALREREERLRQSAENLVQQKRREEALVKTARWRVLKSKGDKLAKRFVHASPSAAFIGSCTQPHSIHSCNDGRLGICIDRLHISCFVSVIIIIIMDEVANVLSCKSNLDLYDIGYIIHTRWTIYVLDIYRYRRVLFDCHSHTYNSLT